MRHVFFLWLSVSACFAQQEDNITSRFNKNSASFLNIKFGKPFPDTIAVDSISKQKVYYSFDKTKRIEKQYRFKATSFGFKADYYTFTIDGNVHLVYIKYQNIDTIQSQSILDTLAALLLPVHFHPSTELFYYEEEFCSALNWIKYDLYKKELIFQLSDTYYCDRLEF
ncbi:MAG: hypothetical protein ACTHJT_03480 [Cytophaga sp.]|uniref:hypothetical protein n=1 Tax=Cytophaga sp. TaxID=29535 RepID=UPI003F8114E2